MQIDQMGLACIVAAQHGNFDNYLHLRGLRASCRTLKNGMDANALELKIQVLFDGLTRFVNLKHLECRPQKYGEFDFLIPVDDEPIPKVIPLNSLINISVLKLERVAHLGDSSLQHLLSLEKISELSLRKLPSITKIAIDQIMQLKTLTSLSVKYCQQLLLTDFSQLHNLSDLEKLVIMSSPKLGKGITRYDLSNKPLAFMGNSPFLQVQSVPVFNRYLDSFGIKGTNTDFKNWPKIKWFQVDEYAPPTLVAMSRNACVDQTSLIYIPWSDILYRLEYGVSNQRLSEFSSEYLAAHKRFVNLKKLKCTNLVQNSCDWIFFNLVDHFQDLESLSLSIILEDELAVKLSKLSKLKKLKVSHPCSWDHKIPSFSDGFKCLVHLKVSARYLLKFCYEAKKILPALKFLKVFYDFEIKMHNSSPIELKNSLPWEQLEGVSLTNRRNYSKQQIHIFFKFQGVFPHMKNLKRFKLKYLDIPPSLWSQIDSRQRDLAVKFVGCNCTSPILQSSTKISLE